MDINQLLCQLLSADNNVRAAAEQQFEAARAQPKQLVEALLPLLQNAPGDELKLMASILLRKLLVRDQHPVWSQLDPQFQLAVKEGLLTSLVHPLPKNIRRKTCDTVAELTELEDQNPLALMPQLLEWTVGNNEHLRLSALMIMSQLLKDCTKELESMLPQVLQAVQQNISLPQSQAEVIQIRLASLDVFCASTSLLSSQYIEQWQSVLPSCMSLVSDLLNLGKENEVRIALQQIIQVAEIDMKGNLLKPHLVTMAQNMSTIASHAQLDDSIRTLALEFQLTIAASAPVLCRKLPDFTNNLFSTAVGLMLDIDDDVNEWNTEDPNDDDNMPENYSVGEEALDRMALSLRWKSIKSACTSLMQQYVKSPDWKHRHAALMSVSQVGEVIPAEELPPIVSAILEAFSDPHPRVRWAAINGIGQLSSDFGPWIQNEYHRDIVPRIISCMGDTANPRVQSHASSAMINFAEHLEPELLMPYLDTILTALQGLLQSPNKFVQEQALPALASVADVAEDKFAKYYDSFMPYLKMILHNAHTQNNVMMRAKAIECISLIGVSVGRDKFHPDAQHVIQYMLMAQQNTKVTPGEPQHSYMLSAWTRVCKCLGEEFLPYLDTVMPPLLETVKLDEVINVEDDSDNDEPEQITVNTGLLEDKATAVNMLYVYAGELKAGFYPWVDRVLTQLLPCLKFVYMEDIRATAALCMPELIKCVVAKVNAEGNGDRSLIKAVFDAIFEPLTQAIAQEVMLTSLSRTCDEDAMSSLLEGLHQSIEVAGPMIMSHEQSHDVCSLIAALVQDYDRKQEMRVTGQKEEDFDEEVAEQFEDEYERDDECLTELALLFSASLKTCETAVIMAHFDELLKDLFLHKLNSDQTSNNIKMALCLFDDVIEKGNGASLPYFHVLVQAIMTYSVNEDPGIRQAAVYGLGACIQHGGEAFFPNLQQATHIIMTMIQAQDARSSTNEAATDNAVSAMCKVMLTYVDTTPSLIPIMIDYLPVIGDKEEGRLVHANLIVLLQRDAATVLGGSLERLPKVLQLFSSFINLDAKLIQADQIPAIKAFCTQLNSQNPQVFQQALATLAPDQQSRLHSL